jgi:hypothetical protein
VIEGKLSNTLIPELAPHFLYRYDREFGRDVRSFAPEVLAQFK